MHYSAEHGLVIACRLSVCLSVCPSATLVDHDHIGWKSWKLIAWTFSPLTSSLFVAQKSSTYSQGKRRNLGGLGVGLALVRSFGTASATPLYFRRWIVPLLLDHTDIGLVLHNKRASRGHLCDSTAFLHGIGIMLCVALYDRRITMKQNLRQRRDGQLELPIMVESCRWNNFTLLPLLYLYTLFHKKGENPYFYQQRHKSTGGVGHILGSPWTLPTRSKGCDASDY